MAAWDDIPDDEKPFQRRLMEAPLVSASTSTSRSAGLDDELEALGYADNTLFVYIWGDNGSSGEGQNGTISELLAQNGIPTTVRQHIDALTNSVVSDVLGSPLVDNQYNAAWAWAAARRTKGMKLMACTWVEPAIRWRSAGRPRSSRRRGAARSVPALQRRRADHLRSLESSRRRR